MDESEVTMDVPEHKFLGPSWNDVSGLSATDFAPVTTVGVENV